jgi:Na+/proline symporter
LIIAGLMAAAMSTFDSLVNAGASYWVRDIYQAFLKPQASDKQLVFQSRLSTIVLVLIGLFLTFNVQNLNDIWGWLTMGIGFGLTIPLLIRWYWWRLNGYGFAWGVAAGMSTALIQRWLWPALPEYFVFLAIVVISLFITIAATLSSQPTDQAVLINFYTRTRPFGFWKPVVKLLDKENEAWNRSEKRRDIISTFLAVPWQLGLFMLFMMIVMKQWLNVFVLAGFVIMLSMGLYFFWYRHLSTIDRLNQSES